MVRGQAGSLRYGSSGFPHFRGRRVTVRFPKSVQVGKAVTLDQSAVLDGFGGTGILIEDGVTIGRHSLISVSGVFGEPGEGIRVGARSAIGANNTIWGQGGVTIGQDCLFGPNVVVVSENHRFDDPVVAIRSQGHRRSPVVIGNDCWVGANVLIAAGVTVGDGAVIGGGSVVTSDVPSRAVVVGNPARVIKYRGASS
ncbi:acyltransferase [Nocardioides sp. Soil777]|uniref:acyltransferase n=1 Tax=Nocardioides sp. Soil777 TaxID=1736409 RepID=UPI0039DFE150